LNGLEKLVTSDNLMDSLKNAVKYTELFKQRFRHVAVRSFMILKNYKGRDISIRKQHRRSQRILDVLQEMDEFPVISESYNEILHDTMDIDNALEVVNGIESGKTSVIYSDYSNTPSPFAHNVILQGISDIILMEDRSALLRELHKKVLEKVFTKKELEQAKFDIKLVEEFFQEKHPEVKCKEDIVPLLHTVGPLRLFVEKGRNIFNYVNLVEDEVRDTDPEGITRDQVLDWCNQLLNEDKITSIWRDGLYWIPQKDLGIYMIVYGRKNLRPEPIDKKILDLIKELNDDARVSSMLKKLGLSKEKLMDRLRDLERKQMIYRKRVGFYIDTEDLVPGETGNIIWGTRDPAALERESELNFGDAADHLIAQYIEFNAPVTLPEISYDLKLDEDLVKQLLNNLEDERMISAGNYVIGKDVPQFMLRTDMVKLELESSGEFLNRSRKQGLRPKVYNWDQVLNYIVHKEFSQVDTIDDYFDKFGIVTSPREIFTRCKNFKIEDWWRMINRGKILQGRFVRGRVCYIRKKDAGMYVDVYRTAPLNPIDIQVLKVIRKKKGATRYEIQNELGLRKTDVVDSIEKLDRNLYIIRQIIDPDEVVDDGTNDNKIVQNDSSSKLGMFKRRGMNRYVSFQDQGRVKGKSPTASKLKSSMKNIILQFLKAHTPVSIRDIYLYTGFNRSDIKIIMDELEASGKVKRFISITEAPTEMFAFPVELELIEEDRELDNKVRILSLLDPFSRRVMASTPMGMSDGWFSPIVYNGNFIGMVELWKMASCIEIRELNLENDDPLILDGVLSELDNLMKFYRMQGIEIVRIRKVFGEELPELVKKRDESSKNIRQMFFNNGYHLIQDLFFAKGVLFPESFNKKDILKYIFYKQHILRSNKFTDPIEAVENMGGIGSDYELKLRLNGKFRGLKELQKSFELAAGRMIPDYYMYCTEDDSRIYQKAKARELDPDMKYVLDNIPYNYGIQPKLLAERLTMPDKELTEVRKKLYDGIYIIRTPTNWYRRVRSNNKISKGKARQLVLKRIIDNFGIFSAENLSAYTKHEFRMNELRSILRDLEQEGYLVKGYFVKGDDTLYWMLKDGLENDMPKLKRSNVDLKNLQFVLNPQDQLAHYLTDEIRQKFGSGSYYVVFNGLEMVGGFKASKKSNILEIKDFVGGDGEWDIVENFMYQNDLVMAFEKKEDVQPEEIYEDFGSYQ
jgi:ATP-dependent Lhr-like helicase